MDFVSLNSDLINYYNLALGLHYSISLNSMKLKDINVVKVYK